MLIFTDFLSARKSRGALRICEKFKKLSYNFHWPTLDAGVPTDTTYFLSKNVFEKTEHCIMSCIQCCTHGVPLVQQDFHLLCSTSTLQNLPQMVPQPSKADLRVWRWQMKKLCCTNKYLLYRKSFSIGYDPIYWYILYCISGIWFQCLVPIYFIYFSYLHTA